MSSKKPFYRRRNQAIKNPISDLMKAFFKVYTKYCTETRSSVSPWVRTAIQECIRENLTLKKIILEQSVTFPRVLFEPLFAALRTVHYQYLSHVYIWNYPLSYENSCHLAIFMMNYKKSLETIYLIDTVMSSDTLRRIVTVVPNCKILTELCIDYNEMSTTDCTNLCGHLICSSLITLSLSYCNLEKECGASLGKLVSNSTISKLYVNGNNLQEDGIIDLIRACAAQAEKEYAKRLASSINESNDGIVPLKKEANSAKTKKKKTKNKGKKIKEKPLASGPWLEKLHIADNGVQLHRPSIGINIINCMKEIKKLIVHSEYFKELDIFGNRIGNIGSQMLLDSLQARKRGIVCATRKELRQRIICKKYSVQEKGEEEKQSLIIERRVPTISHSGEPCQMLFQGQQMQAKLPDIKIRSSYRVQVPDIYLPLYMSQDETKKKRRERKVNLKDK